MGQWIENLPAVQETQKMQIWSLGREDSPGRGNGNPLHYSCLKNPIGGRAKEAGGLQSKVSQRIGHDWVTKLAHVIGV